MKKRNRERAKRVQATLEFYKAKQKGESGPVEYSDLEDLLADIRHYCDLKNYDFAENDRAGYGHYLTSLWRACQ